MDLACLLPSGDTVWEIVENDSKRFRVNFLADNGYIIGYASVTGVCLCDGLKSFIVSIVRKSGKPRIFATEGTSGEWDEGSGSYVTRYQNSCFDDDETGLNLTEYLEYRFGRMETIRTKCRTNEEEEPPEEFIEPEGWEDREYENISTTEHLIRTYRYFSYYGEIPTSSQHPSGRVYDFGSLHIWGDYYDQMATKFLTTYRYVPRDLNEKGERQGTEGYYTEITPLTSDNRNLNPYHYLGFANGWYKTENRIWGCFEGRVEITDFIIDSITGEIKRQVGEIIVLPLTCYESEPPIERKPIPGWIVQVTMCAQFRIGRLTFGGCIARTDCTPAPNAGPILGPLLEEFYSLNPGIRIIGISYNMQFLGHCEVPYSEYHDGYYPVEYKWDVPEDGGSPT